MKKKKVTKEEQDEIQEDTTSMEEKLEALDEASEPKEEQESVAVALAGTTTATPTGLAEQIQATETKIKLLGEFIQRQLKENVDFGSIAFHAKNCPHKGCPDFATKLGPKCTAPFCKMSKPFLQKPGSEKFVILFNHRAKFIWIQQDFQRGIFAVKCLLVDKKTDKSIGEGYGSARVSEKDKWTENEAMKIACKRAQIDASLRTYGLSEHFAQDLDDIAGRQTTNLPQNRPETTYNTPTRPYNQNYQNNPPKANFTPSNPNAPMSLAQNNKIFMLLSKLGKDKDWLERWIFQVSGIEGVENLTMGWASKIIDSMQKKYDQIVNEGMDVINYDEPAPKRDIDTSVPPPEQVELDDDQWNGF